MDNMDDLFVKYREVLLNQNTYAKYRTISINTGGIQNVLQDIKVSKTAGGFSYQKNEHLLQNRFIYWRTAHDVLQISEISLDYNLRNNNVQINFEESPILSVEIFENCNKGIVILIATITSIHRIFLNHSKCNVMNDGTCDSILSSLTRETITDPRTFHIIGTEIGTNLPNAASSYAVTDPEVIAYFSITSSSNLYLFQIQENGGVKMNELKYNQIMPRFLSNITDALRRKNMNDMNNITSITFGRLIENQVVLYALYRDNTLRLWSTTAQCLATEYCSKYSECKASGSQNNIVRESNSIVCLFLSFSDNSEFILFKTSIDDSSNVSLKRELVILSPQYDLIDFKISTNKIWALWCTSQGEHKVLLYKLNENAQQYWYPVGLESITEKKSNTLESGVDPRHTFCSQIFYPGRFQHETILKAFLMFNRSFSYSDNSLSTTALKRHVCMAIDSEIQNEKKQNNLSNEEYVDLSAKVWEKFYHCCEQYHIAASQPIGLLILPEIDYVCIIKNKQISFLRPCDQIEISFLSGNYYTTNSPCQKLANDMKNLISILKSIDECLSLDCKSEIDKKMYQLIPPNDIISTEISLQDVVKDSNILPKIQMINDLPKVMNILLSALKFDDVIEPREQQCEYLKTGYSFGSFIGVQLITETTKQIIHLRYILCRNLLILEYILIQNFVLNCNATEIVRSKCLPDTVIFLQSYYVMVWISESVVDYNAIKAQTRFSKTAGQNSLGLIIRQDESSNIEYMTLLQFFIASKGLKYTVERVNAHQEFLTTLNISTILSKLTWSISGDFIFGEWLYDNNLLLFIEEYVRLLNYWCEYNNYSRHFILGWSYLNNGENFKALDVFLETANGVNLEPFLIKFVGILQDGSIQHEDILSTFYLKIIRLFEQQQCAFDCVNIVSQIALGATDLQTQKAMFQSICFNSYMTLGHYEEAYHSLISNCDPTRRKDCLRQLVWCLFDCKRFDILMEFPYIGLENDFQNIIETKARSVEIIDNDQYDFLYSFYIIKGNMRKAASIMYEKAYRCYLECNSVSYLKIRYNSLLCSNNALNLVDKDYAWITRPSIKCQNDTNKSKIKVLTLQDIKKELLICEALLNVVESSIDLKSILDMGPTELISLLTNERLYTAAIKLAHGCDMKCTLIYESLTYALIQSCSADSADTWDWLNKNNLLDITTNSNATQTVVLLLRHFLENEIHDKDLYNRTILNQLLINNFFLPQWLSDWFKINNPTELLKLLVKYGRLEEAFDLIKDYFCENLLKKTEQIMMIPISFIDVLLYEMKSREKHNKKTAELEELLHYSFSKIK